MKLDAAQLLKYIRNIRFKQLCIKYSIKAIELRINLRVSTVSMKYLCSPQPFCPQFDITFSVVILRSLRSDHRVNTMTS